MVKRTGTFREALAAKGFVITAEVGPPKGMNTESFRGHVSMLKGLVDGINVTDNQKSVMRYSSLGGCLLVKEAGESPILQMTCRDRNRLALGGDLLVAASRGIDTVLCLTGDSITAGDQPQAKQVFDLDSVQLITMIREFEKGRDLGGNALEETDSWCVGATVTPEADPIEPQLMKFEKKVEAGAEFFQTQAIYDLDNFRRFMEYARGFPVKILAGIVLLTSPAMAEYMNSAVPGVWVPQGLIDELEAAPKGERLAAGIRIAVRMIRSIREEGLCDGVHIMAIGRERVIPEIIRLAGDAACP
ncbi:MAG: methylenetetrahydrofolate reductase [bacterium]